MRSVLSPRAEDVLAEAAVAADALHDIELLQRVVVTWAYRHGGATIFRARPAARGSSERSRRYPITTCRSTPACSAPPPSSRCYDDPTRAWELLRVAQEMAASTADDRATLDVAIAELNVFWSLAPPDRTWSQRALQISDDIEELARKTRDAAALADAT